MIEISGVKYFVFPTVLSKVEYNVQGVPRRRNCFVLPITLDIIQIQSFALASILQQGLGNVLAPIEDILGLANT